MGSAWLFLLPLVMIGYVLWSRRSASAADVKALLAEGAQIVDVRTTAEFSAQSHPRAKNIPLDQLEARLGELDPKRPVLVCCESGSRSGVGASLLSKRGFKNVANLGPWRRIHTLLA